jgi:hypothetical protein
MFGGEKAATAAASQTKVVLSYDRDDSVGHGRSVTVMVAKSGRRGRNYDVVCIAVCESPLTPALLKFASTMSLDRTILLVEPCGPMKRFIRLAPHG